MALRHAQGGRGRHDGVGRWVAGFTVTLALPVEAAKVAAPPKLAVIVSVPTGKVVIVNLATPALRFPVPSDAPPLANVTIPVGVPEEDATVAVSVTLPPAVIETGFAATVVVVPAMPGAATVTVTGAETEAA